jgi:hypothetical protein
MDSLNPSWLSIELDSIDADIEKWNEALRTSYEASFGAITREEKRLVAQNSLATPNSCDS